MEPKVKMIDTVNKNRLVMALMSMGAIEPIRPENAEQEELSKNLQEKFKGVGLVVQFRITPMGEYILHGQVLRRVAEQHGKEVLKLPSEERREYMKKTIDVIKAELGGQPSMMDMLLSLLTESCEDAGLFKPDPEGGQA